MDAGTRMRVFEPFFTTKPMGKGTGLGLALVWGTIQGHGGTVTVDSELGRGSTFTVHIPLSAERAPEIEAPNRRSRPVIAQKASTVLVIDDEPTIRAATTRLLERLGHHVLTAADGAEGLRVFDEACGLIDLVILDMGMPVMGGADCFERLRERSQVPVLIATGYALEEEAQALVARGAALLEKPFASAVLICEIERLIGSGNHSRGSRDVSEISPKAGAIVALRASQEGNHERANESEDPGHRAAVSVGTG
jgi:CheY-like chemotaxis protein